MSAQAADRLTYSIRMVGRTRELRDAGWTCEEVADHLHAEFGMRPVQSTISRWADPSQRLKDATTNSSRSARARAERSRGRFRRLPQTPEFKMARMRGLRDEAGLKVTQIARVMAFDFGDVMSRDTVERALASNEYPRTFR